ncbi:MAG: tRNA pseudouridine(55) synthase TruB [Lachnospiraceae bacterium]|nr:tRNA pseudouridine(55) synthase TruB [Lachnospiraceae bacterium]
MLNGIINVYKEAGFTSHDVVAKLRGILKQKKIGHTGTLDPDATGVLPVCLGNGTRLCDMLADKSKEYVAVMRLGVVTDTQDMSGQILQEKEVVCTEEEVQAAILSFVGEYSQIPPMYSALKVNGKKLYELAREGKEIERQPRQVFISEIEILSMELPLVKFRVGCSKGTYIRTLCQDIGEKLGCGATMESLQRTRVGGFVLENALTLTEIEELTKAGTILEKIMPADFVFSVLPKVLVKKEFRKRIDNGNYLLKKQMNVTEGVLTEEQGVQCRIYNDEGVFCGIYEYRAEDRQWKPVKMFPVM